MSTFALLETIILDVLCDNEWHSYSEIKAKIYESNRELLKTRSYLSVVLDSLKKRKIIEHKPGALYCRKMNTKEIRKKKMEEMEKRLRTEMLEKWEEFYKKTFSNVASYEMSTKQFVEGKWRFELNKKVEELIATIQIPLDEE